jgi:hypothetical protein
MRVQLVRKKDIWPHPPPYLVRPPGTRGVKFNNIKITKKFVFKPLRAPGSRQPDAEGRISMRIAAMDDNRYCCGDAIGR